MSLCTGDDVWLIRIPERAAELKIGLKVGMYAEVISYPLVSGEHTLVKIAVGSGRRLRPYHFWWSVDDLTTEKPK